MATDIHQDIVIDRINHYLKYNNLPIELDNNGICNGLAFMHVKYVLEGREDFFMSILQAIAGDGGLHQIEENELNLFIVETLIAFFPQQYEQRLRQSTGIETLKVNGKFLKSAFDFALVSTDEHWADVLTTLALKKNEVVQITSCDHAASFYKTDWGYRLYDPNYSSGYKDYSSERELITELHKHVFCYGKSLLGMTLHVIRHPDDLSERVFPIAKELYERHLIDINVDARTEDDNVFNLLTQAAMDGDSSLINCLLDRGVHLILVLQKIR